MAWALQQFRPQLLMMRIRARGAIALKANRYNQVFKLVENGVEELRQFYREARPDGLDGAERGNSIAGNLASGNPGQTATHPARTPGKRPQRSREE